MPDRADMTLVWKIGIGPAQRGSTLEDFRHGRDALYFGPRRGCANYDVEILK
jgi:hypothetical protein